MCCVQSIVGIDLLILSRCIRLDCHLMHSGIVLIVCEVVVIIFAHAKKNGQHFMERNDLKESETI